jgi:hypothetical protein
MPGLFTLNSGFITTAIKYNAYILSQSNKARERIKRDIKRKSNYP